MTGEATRLRMNASVTAETRPGRQVRAAISPRFAVLAAMSVLVVPAALSFLDRGPGAEAAAAELPYLVQPRAASHVVPSSDEVARWAASVALSSYSSVTDGRNGEVSRSFTSDGWKSFQRALEASGTVDIVVSRRMHVLPALTGSPVVIQTGTAEEGRYWIVLVPMRIRYVPRNGDPIRLDLAARVRVIQRGDAQRALAVAQIIGHAI